MVAKKATEGSRKPRTRRAGKNNTKPLFPNFIKEWREAQKMTQSELAREVGIAPQQINRLENHTVALTYQMASKIAPVLCENIGQLFSVDPTDKHVALDGVIQKLGKQGREMLAQHGRLLLKQGF